MLRHTLILLFAFQFLALSQDYISTSHKPIELIIKELVGTKVKVRSIRDGNKLANNSKSLVDNSKVFITNRDTIVGAGKKTINIQSLLGNQAIANGYFWLSPTTIKLLLPKLRDTLSKLLPQSEQDIRINADNFEKKLDLIHKQILKLNSGNKSNRIVALDAGFEYFAKSYNLQIELTYNRDADTKQVNEKLNEQIKLILANEKASIVSSEHNINLIDKEISFAIKTNVFYFDILATNNKEKYADFILAFARRMNRALH
jgi:ABC-type Zn uptake system ZnuABC Zn-binding protein ZnuA